MLQSLLVRRKIYLIAVIESQTVAGIVLATEHANLWVSPRVVPGDLPGIVATVDIVPVDVPGIVATAGFVPEDVPGIVATAGVDPGDVPGIVATAGVVLGIVSATVNSFDFDACLVSEPTLCIIDLQAAYLIEPTRLNSVEHEMH